LLDLKDGFHQIKVHPNSTKYFAFATPDGQFEYQRLPFGFSESPAEFQRRLLFILRPLIRNRKVIVYIDDVMIASETVEENLEVLREVLILFKQYGFELNFKKCKFLKRAIEYLGYVITPQGITISPRHTEAIKNYPRPRNVLEVQRFLGLINFQRKFIQNFAMEVKPLRQLTCKDAKFDFNQNCIDAFENIKKLLTAQPILCLYDPYAETELHTDASSPGFGGILVQKQKNGNWGTIGYYNQPTNKSERNYHSYELEMLAIVRSIERFHIYLYGIKFTVITDCNALTHAVNKANLNPRIARWTLALQNYKFQVKHRPSQKMSHVDALSRVVLYIESLPLERELELKQLQDVRLKAIAADLEFGNHDKFELIDGLVYRKAPDRSRFAVPESMVANVIRTYHDEMAHCGFEKTLRGITATYWFPSMRKRIIEHIDNCLVCIVANSSSHAKEGEMQIAPSAKFPLETIFIDHFGPLPVTENGFRHIFVVVDSLTRFTWLFPTKSTTSKEVIFNCNQIFRTFGNPMEVVSDRGTAFTSGEFLNFTKSLNIKHRQVAVASPWANGLVERVNRFLKSSLKKLVTIESEWTSSVDKAQYVLNNSYHSTIKSTPAKLLLGYECRNHNDNRLTELLNSLAEVDKDINIARETIRDLAREATERLQSYNKQLYDARHTAPTKYRIGDYVMIRDLQNKPGVSSKFKPAYKGPYMIAQTLNKNRYVVKDIPGFNECPKPYNSILSPDKLKPWIKPSL